MPFSVNWKQVKIGIDALFNVDKKYVKTNLYMTFCDDNIGSMINSMPLKLINLKSMITKMYNMIKLIPGRYWKEK